MFELKPWPVLFPGDIVDIIAPASACLTSESPLEKIQDLLISWELVPRISAQIFGHDLLCANSDQERCQFFKNALVNNESKAIWCLRGGYGSARFILNTADIPITMNPKLFVGMSDITALHLLLQKRFGWITLHGPSARQVADKSVDEENISELKDIMFGKKELLDYQKLIPLNTLATENKIVDSIITGGNLSLVQTSIGTSWQIDPHHKILFLEETNERGYRVDRMLLHLEQAGIFNNVSAILFGDFTGGFESNGQSLINPVLERFARNVHFPVLRYFGIGHEKYNRPLPLGSKTRLQLGSSPTMTVAAGFNGL